MDDMKEIRGTALDYYNNLSKEQQREIKKTFQQMDLDGDGTITIKEFKNVFKDSKIISGDSITRLFSDMDKDGDGSLDFEEAITFCYVLKNQRIAVCHVCQLSIIKGLYFTCVDCFDCHRPFRYDLCISCYGGRKYWHKHSNFLDNYALLLRRKSTAANQDHRWIIVGSSSKHQPTTPSTSATSGNGSYYPVPGSISETVVPGSTSKTVETVKGIGNGVYTGIQIGNGVYTGISIASAISSCTIM